MAPNFQASDKVIHKSFSRSLKLESKSAEEIDDARSLSCPFLSRKDSTGNNLDEFESFEKVILEFESNFGMSKRKGQSYLWEDSIGEAKQYLLAVDNILQLIENRSLLSSDAKFSDRVTSLLQTVMSRLEEEFQHMLVKNSIPLDVERLAERLSFSMSRISLSCASNDGASEDFEGSVDDEQENFEEKRFSSGEDTSLEVMNPDATLNLKEIAERMVKAGYEKECRQVYCSVRRDALYEYLSILGVENTTIEEVQKLDWGTLDDKMKKWIQAVKTSTRFLLFAEKQLCNHIFGGSEKIVGACFTETAKECVLQLLNFGEAVAVVPRSPEKLFRILDMYDELTNVRLDLKALFSDESGDSVFVEVEGVLVGLAEAAKGTFKEFENAVQSESSRKVTLGGEIHPLTRYVMNYIKLLVDYKECLALVFEERTDSSDGQERNAGVTSQSDSISPMGRRLMSIISSLETNLETKSKLYDDAAMQHIFLMNNILYIVQKVKGSELGKLLGDHWVRRRRSQVRQYATYYLRASWNRVLPLLKDEGLGGSGSSSSISKVALKERFKNFNAVFEEIYKSQSAWKVPDAQLRDELRIMISERLLPAYRSFAGRFRCHLDSGRNAGRYVKYTPDDIENFLADLFEGFPRDLKDPKRKPST